MQVYLSHVPCQQPVEGDPHIRLWLTLMPLHLTEAQNGRGVPPPLDLKSRTPKHERC